MRASVVVLFLFAASLWGEIHTMTLRQALDTALAQNPDVMLARLDRQHATDQVDVTRDPFALKLGVGSGLAYTYGFPSSIDGSAPSIFQARAQMAIFDRPQRYRVDQAREAARGSEFDIDLRRQDVAYQVYAAFLNAEQAARSVDAVSEQIASLERVKDLVATRVSEGAERPIESNRANVDLQRARLTMEDFTVAQTNAEITLAQILGMPPGDQVRPAQEERTPPEVPESEQETIDQAISESREIRRLESNLQAKRLEVRSYDAERLPKINLVGQYSLLARFNNFDKFYPRFQRNNAQIGASFEIPLFLGTAPSAAARQAESDIAKIQVELGRTRSRISADIKRAYADLRRAELARDLASDDLALSRQETSIVLVEFDEGRSLRSQVEAARATEQQKWVAYYDAQRGLEAARVNVLRDSGLLLAALQ